MRSFFNNVRKSISGGNSNEDQSQSNTVSTSKSISTTVTSASTTSKPISQPSKPISQPSSKPISQPSSSPKPTTKSPLPKNSQSSSSSSSSSPKPTTKSSLPKNSQSSTSKHVSTSQSSTQSSTQSSIQSSTQSSTPVKPNRPSITNNRGLGQGNNVTNTTTNSLIPQRIITAAQALSDAIQEILCDTASLQENNSGYERLLVMIELQDYSEDVYSISKSGGVGCMQILLNNLEYPQFAEICNQIALATNLMHALRLLRMYEIKDGQSVQNKNKTRSKKDEVGKTFHASKRLCTVFGRLCVDAITIEKLRQSLLKLLTYPLSILPLRGLHLQKHVSNVISQMCKSGLSAPHIWFLHDIEAMKHMVRDLGKLTAIPTEIDGNDIMLRGLDGENEGMWIVGLECIVDIITATVSINPILMTDFEAAGGYSVFLHIMENSSADKIIQVMSAVTRLLYDPTKTDEPVTFPGVAVVFADYMISVLGLTQCVKMDDGMEKLISMSNSISQQAADNLSDKEYAIQNIAYTLLTLYSNDTRNCTILEEAYHFLPTLVVSIPALKDMHSISAVLTTLNYICQCVETSASLSVISLCAAATVIANTALSHGNFDQASQQQLVSCCSSFDAIVRGHSKFSTIILRCGMLQYLIISPLKQFHEMAIGGKRIDRKYVPIYDKIIDLMIIVFRRNPSAYEEIRNSDLQSVIRSLLTLENVEDEFCSTILHLPEEFAKADTMRLEENMNILINILLTPGLAFGKMRALLMSLSNILLSSEESAQTWRKLNGLKAFFGVIGRIGSIFRSNDDAVVSVGEAITFSFFEAATHLYTVHLTISASTRCDQEYDNLMAETSYNNLKISAWLLNSNVFSSHYAEDTIDLIFKIICGWSDEERILHPKAVEILIEILPHIHDLAINVVKRLQKYTDNSYNGAQLLCDAGVTRNIIAKYSPIFFGHIDPVGESFFDFVKSLISKYLTMEDFYSLMYYMVRIEVHNGQDAYKLLLPWQSFKSSSTTLHSTLKFLNDLSSKSSRIAYSASHVVLGGTNNSVEPAYMTILMSENSKQFPLQGFSISMWLQIPGSEEALAHSLIPIFSARLNSNHKQCFLEVHFDREKSLVNILCHKGKVATVLVFSSPIPVNKDKWVSIVVTSKRLKQQGKLKSIFNVYINGLVCAAENLDDWAELDSPTQGQAVDILVGKYLMLGKEKRETETGPIEVTIRPNPVPVWYLGSVLFFDEILTQGHVTMIFLKGETYDGTMQAESATPETTSTISTLMLRKCNTISMSSDNYLENLCLKGLESLVEPLVDAPSVASPKVEFSSVPAPIIAYSANNAIHNFASSNDMSLKSINLSLLNTVSESNLPIASISNGFLASTTQSVAMAVASLGGPSILFPILQAASDEESICQCLQLINSCISENSINLMYMQSIGYKICAFLLSQKPKEIITKPVFDCIWDICTSNCVDESVSLKSSLLFVDTTAFYNLILNNQVWGMKRIDCASHILKNISLLVKDSKYGSLNSKRLSLLGVTKWILLICMYGAACSAENTSKLNNNETSWKMSNCTFRDIAEGTTIPDPFLSLATSNIHEIMRIDIRKKHLDELAKSILLMVSVQRKESIMLDEIEEITFSPQSTQTVSKSIRSPHKDNTEMDSFSLVRFHFIKLVMNLFEESSGVSLFRGSFSPEWFLALIDQMSDVATCSIVLRLLGLILQRDLVFQKDFFAKDGLKILGSHLTSTTQPFSVILPLLAMLFRIPMAIMPLAGQVKDVNKILQFLDMPEECLGPDVSEPGLSEFTLPILSLIFECMYCTARARNKDTFSLQNEIILNLFEKAYVCNQPFKQLMQNKSAIEMLSNAILQCSNAVDDYGSVIYTTKAGTSDLSLSLREDYIQVDSNGEAFSPPMSPDVSQLNKGDEVIDISLLGTEGPYLFDMIASTVFYAVSEFKNSSVVSTLILFIPQNLVKSCICGFQKIIIQQASNAIQRILQGQLNLTVIQTICTLFTHLIPLSSAGILDNKIQIDILQLAAIMMQQISMLPPSHYGAKEDKHNQVIKSLGATARFFSVACMQAVLPAVCFNNQLKLEILSTVRSHLHLLLQPSISDDVGDLSAMKLKPSNDEKTSASAILEALQSALNGQKPNDSSILALAQSTRVKVSQLFSLSIICCCFKLFFEQDTAVRLEALRIFAMVNIHRRNIVEQLFTTSFKSTDAADLFKDGIYKLLPVSNMLIEEYSTFLRGESEMDDQEDLRVNNFIQWMTTNYRRCAPIMDSMNTVYVANVPQTSDAQEAVRMLQSIRLKEDKRLSLQISSLTKREEYLHKESESIYLQLKKWQIYGLIYLANGANRWKREWNTLQAGQIWGYLPICSDSKILNLALQSKSWRLDLTEGPERACKRLEQDFKIPSTYLVHHDDDDEEIAPIGNFEMKRRESAAEDMEDFLKEIAKKGVQIKRLEDRQEGYDENEDEELTLTEYNKTRDTMTDAVFVSRQSIEVFNPEFDVEALEDLSPNPNRSQSPLGGVNTSEPTVVDTDSPFALLKFDNDKKSAMLLEIIKGVIGVREWNVGMTFNVHRISGLEVQPAIVILTNNNIHILTGFQLKTSLNKKEKTVVWVPSVQPLDENSRFALRPEIPINTSDSLADTDNCDEGTWLSNVWKDFLSSDLSYQKTPLDTIYSIFKKRHQLKNLALEVADVMGCTILFACDTVNESDIILSKLLEAELPQSIFYKVIGIKNIEIMRGLSNTYNKIMAMFVSRITKMWHNGELTNFEYLIHLNSAAGRSFQDLTQYPVFPWILADYSSDNLDLNDPKTFRDLSKPMGAIGEKRARQYKDRYSTLDEFQKMGMDPNSPPPFFYGTHYSCAGYVLHYLVRMQPFSDMAISLQGGQFDKSDRLFLSIENSWKSASQENLQDVRELIPEFFYMPEFLANSSRLNLGKTQKGDVVGDVSLPAWAKGDPKEFIRIHREALESRYVSENLHEWIDLVFGYKQRGAQAVDAMNVFIHLTYDGEVDIDAIMDPVLRDATIAQINNFGQCPSKLFNKPHPRRQVPDYLKKFNDVVSTDSYALAWHEYLSPALCVVGASEYCLLNKVSHSQVAFPSSINKGAAVGDMRLVSKEKIIAVPTGCVLVAPYKKYIRFDGTCGTLNFCPLSSPQRIVEVGVEVISTYENFHKKKISCVAVSKDGDLIATGSEDLSIRLWSFKDMLNRKVELLCTYCGHYKNILCLDINADFQLLVSGSADHSVGVWDIRSKKMIRMLPNHTGPVLGVSIGSISGVIATITSSELRLYSINGVLLSSFYFSLPDSETASMPPGRVVLAPPCAEWQDGVVAVTGHEKGYVYLWKLKIQRDGQVTRTLVPFPLTKTHRTDITSLRLCSNDFSNKRSKDLVTKCFDSFASFDLLVGDEVGYVSRWSPSTLDQLAPSDLHEILNKYLPKRIVEKVSTSKALLRGLERLATGFADAADSIITTVPTSEGEIEFLS